MPATSLRQAAKTQKPFLKQPLHIFYSLLFLVFWVYTASTTPDLQNWATENILTLSVLICLAAFYNIFRFSDTSYTLILLFLLLHVYGSQYQYSENPFGYWVKATLNQDRNNYDRLVHFCFGLLLAYPAHELLLRAFKVKRIYSYLLPLELILSFGAIYELAEWLVADVFYNGSTQGMTYVGTQGDEWDAHKDIALGLAGGIIAISITFILYRLRRSGNL